MSGVARVHGAALLGVDGVPVEVEVRLSSQLPRVDIVGLPEAEVRESAARVRSAIAASGCRFPDRRVTVNLAPAGVRKSGAGLDLAIAVAILAAAGILEPGCLETVGLLGELALDGRLRGVRGALAQGIALAEAGCHRIVGPHPNQAELALVPGGPPEVARSLPEVLEALQRGLPLHTAQAAPCPAPTGATAADLRHIRGQERAKRALEVAAAGGHGLLLLGPPGAGKTLLARALPGILPPLEPDEALEVTRIHGAAGLLRPEAPLVQERPFRTPHHSASRAGLLGGGRPTRPGEVSLAHHGVLFLDELPEFERRSLEALRQVLEDGCVVLSRAESRLVLPARLQLVAAANPCPCGFFRSGIRDCRCDDGRIERYQGRLSGPLLDRIDLHVFVPALSFPQLEGPPAEASEKARARVCAARRLQAARRGPGPAVPNARIPLERMEAWVAADAPARQLLGRAVTRMGLSARAAHRALRVARTIADLAGEEQVGAAAVAEAIGYRPEASGPTGAGYLK